MVKSAKYSKKNKVGNKVGTRTRKIKKINRNIKSFYSHKIDGGGRFEKTTLLKSKTKNKIKNHIKDYKADKKGKTIKYYRIDPEKLGHIITREEVKKMNTVIFSNIQEDMMFDVTIIEGDNNIYVILYDTKNKVNNLVNKVKIENNVNNPEAINLDEAIDKANRICNDIEDFIDSYYIKDKLNKSNKSKKSNKLNDNNKIKNHDIEKNIKDASYITKQLQDSIEASEKLGLKQDKIKYGKEIEKRIKQKIEELKKLIINSPLQKKLFQINKNIYIFFKVFTEIFTKLRSTKYYINKNNNKIKLQQKYITEAIFFIIIELEKLKKLELELEEFRNKIDLVINLLENKKLIVPYYEHFLNNIIIELRNLFYNLDIDQYLVKIGNIYKEINKTNNNTEKISNMLAQFQFKKEKLDNLIIKLGF